MKKTVGIIGAGDIGLNLAEILAIKGYDIIVYNRYHEVDSSPSPYWLSKMGKIMDMNDSLQIDNCGQVKLTSNIDDLSESQYVVITAGVKRTSSEETREELASKNAKIIDNYLNFIIQNPQILILIVSNPVDFLTKYVIKKLKSKSSESEDIISRKIVGVSYIDSMRLKNLVKEFINKHHPDKKYQLIESLAIGEHGPSMVPLISSIKIGDNYLHELAEPSQIEYIKQHTILRGNDIIKLTGASSVKGPAHAAMHMIDIISNNDIVTITASVWDGSRAIGNLAKFKLSNFAEIINVNLSSEEKIMFDESQKALDAQYENIMKIINDTI